MTGMEFMGIIGFLLTVLMFGISIGRFIENLSIKKIATSHLKIIGDQ